MPLISEHDVRQAASSGRRHLAVEDDAVVTPQALEVAERLGVTIRHGRPAASAVPGIDAARAVQRLLLRRSPRWTTPQPRRGITPSRFIRVAFVGSGMVGATAAHLTALSGMADELALIDLVPGLAAATALDIEHASGITGASTRARGGTSLKMVAGAQVVVVTAGRPRSPGMTRAALLEINGRVVRDVAEAIREHAPHAVVIVVTNPVDEMTYELWRASGLDDHRVLGMAGTLDSSRFRDALATAAGVKPRDVSAVALGSHGAEMVPILSSVLIKGRPALEVLTPGVLEKCAKTAVDGGATVVALRKTGSAFIAPAHAIVELMDALRGATAEPVPVSTMLHGEYGIEGVFVGVRAVLTMDGVAKIVEDALDERETEQLRNAAESIRQRLDMGR